MGELRYILAAFLVVVGSFLIIGFLQSLLISSTKTPVYSYQTEQTISIDPILAKGKKLFQQNCQQCHSIYIELTGPPLGGFTTRGPWVNQESIYRWVNNPAVFMTTDQYTQDLKKKYQVIMPAFPDFTAEDIDAIVKYIEAQSEPVPQPAYYVN